MSVGSRYETKNAVIGSAKLLKENEGFLNKLKHLF